LLEQSSICEDKAAGESDNVRLVNGLNALVVRELSCHGVGESELETFDEVKEGEVGVGELVANEEGLVGGGGDEPIEVAVGSHNIEMIST
jgi:hypothetical protein